MYKTTILKFFCPSFSLQFIKTQLPISSYGALMPPAIGVSISLKKDVFFVSYMSFGSGCRNFGSHKLCKILDALFFIVFTANLFIHPVSF
jgi:hypothetical protein